MDQVQVTSGKTLWKSSSGSWAAQRFLKALQNGEDLDSSVLRTLDTLRKDEWIAFDEALLQAARIRLVAVQDLMNAGLTRPVANAIGKTMFEWEAVSDMEDAQVSLDGVTRSEQDREVFSLAQLPLPITHKDFYINLRTLAASRERGDSLDTSQIETCGRKIGELTEKVLFQGYGNKFGGAQIYGYMTHPNRAKMPYGDTDKPWNDATKTGEQMLADLLTMIQALHNNKMYGPYWLYVPSDAGVRLENDFKANSDKTIRQRLLEVENVQAVRTADQLPTQNTILVQGTMDVAAMVDGENLQTVQWDAAGGFQVHFKAWQILVPLVRADYAGNSGVAHMYVGATP